MYEFSLFLGPIDLLTTNLCQCLVGILYFVNLLNLTVCDTQHAVES